MIFRFVFPAVLLSLYAASALADPPSAVSDPIFSKLPAQPEPGDGKWEGSLGFGLTLSRGNDNATQGSFSGDAVRAMRDSRLIAHLLLIRSSTSGERRSEVGVGTFRGERNFDTDMFGFGDATLERDLKNDLARRASLSAGIGKRLHDTKDWSLNAYAGVALVDVRYYQERDARGAELLFGEDGSWRLSETSSISHRFVLFPRTVGVGGMRTALQGDISTRITDRFGLQLAVLHKYQAHVVPGNKHNDLTIYTGLTSKF